MTDSEIEIELNVVPDTESIAQRFEEIGDMYYQAAEALREND